MNVASPRRPASSRAVWALGFAWVAAVVCVLPASADIRRRWYLDFELGAPANPGAPVWPPDEIIDKKVEPERKDLNIRDYVNQAPLREFLHRKPQLFQYSDRLGGTSLYWFAVFTLHNPLDRYVPLQIDAMLHTDQGKDFQQDVVRTQPAVAGRGKFYSSVIQPPDVELKIVSELERLGNRNEEMRRERLAELKKEGRYLNPAEVRRKAVLRPDETVTCLAVFRDVDRHSDTLELLIGGLFDVVRIDKVERERTHYVFENRILHHLFDMPGDEFSDNLDFVSLRLPRKRWWEIQPVGPMGDRQALVKLIAALDSADPPDRLREKLPTVAYGPALRRGANEALKKMTGEDYGYDADKEPSDPVNVDAIRLWREWWTRNAEKLVYNETLNKYEIKKQEIPGQVEVKAPFAE